MVADVKIGPVFVTKYALSRGILRWESVRLIESIGMPERKWVSRNNWENAHPPYWYTSEEEAQFHAQKLVDAKLAALERQKAKLLKLKKNGVKVVEVKDG